MSWMDRLKENIILTSPKGSTFTALWRGNPISVKKRVGVFQYPGLDGANLQDMGLEPFTWPLTIYFDGDDHDLTAFAFLMALKERGVWTVVHPVYGTRSLQPVSVDPVVNPTEQGGYTEVTSSWIEPAATSLGLSTDDTVGQTQAQIAVVNSTAAGQVQTTATLTTADQIAAVRNTCSAIMSAIKTVINFNTASISTIYAQTVGAITGPILDIVSVVGAYQQLMQTPGLIAGDISAKVTAYRAIFTTLGAATTKGTDATDKNAAAVVEAFSCATLAALAQDITLTTYATRPQAVQAMTDLRALFDLMTANLDAVQTRFGSVGIDLQYFSNTQGYSVCARLVGLALTHLLQATFSLKTAVTIILDRPRAPIEMAITYYGTNGWDDSLFDYFLMTNNLHGNDILILAAGRSVVIYV